MTLPIESPLSAGAQPSGHLGHREVHVGRADAQALELPLDERALDVLPGLETQL